MICHDLSGPVGFKIQYFFILQRIQWLGAKLARITEANRRLMSQKDVFDILDEICEHFQDVIPLPSAHNM